MLRVLPYLLAEWDEMKKLYRGPYIDAFCQVWFHLVQLIQRSRLKYEKLTDGRRTPSDGLMLAQTGVVGREGVALDVTGVGDEGSAVKLKSFYCSDVFGLYRMLFTIAGQAVSEEKIFFLISSPLFSNFHNRS
jgi:hypothetical protein